MQSSLYSCFSPIFSQQNQNTRIVMDANTGDSLSPCDDYTLMIKEDLWNAIIKRKPDRQNVLRDFHSFRKLEMDVEDELKDSLHLTRERFKREEHRLTKLNRSSSDTKIGIEVFPRNCPQNVTLENYLQNKKQSGSMQSTLASLGPMANRAKAA
jgi:hypothetical protein